MTVHWNEKEIMQHRWLETSQTGKCRRANANSWLGGAALVLLGSGGGGVGAGTGGGLG